MKRKRKFGGLAVKAWAGLTIVGLTALSLPMGLAISLIPVNVDQGLQMASAQSTATLTGIVANPDGSALGVMDSAFINLRPEGPGQGFGENSGVGGAFTISSVPHGNYFITASAGPTSSYTSSAEQKVVVSGTSVSLGTIKLTNPNLTGTAVDPNGNALDSAMINLRSGDYMVNRGTQSDENGVFKFGGLSNGVYIITVQAPQGSPYSEGEVSVTVTDSNTVKNIGNVSLSTPNVTGRVVDPNGAPLVLGPGVEMNINVEIYNQDRTVQKNTQADSNGIFRFGSMPSGAYTLSTRVSGNTSYTSASDRSLTVVQGVLLNVGDVALSNPQITGTVTNPDGSPAANTWVQVHNDNWSVQAGGSTNQSGVYTVGGLAAGTYKLMINTPWGTSGVIAPDEKSVTITAGGSVQTVNAQFIAATKFIVGTVKKSNGAVVTNARVEANKEGSHSEANTNADGSFQLSLGAGSWEIRVGARMEPGAEAPDWIFEGFGEVVQFKSDSSIETKTLNLTVKVATSRVTGKVVGPDGSPISNAHVDVRNQEGQGSGQPVDPQGNFSIPISAGNYRINIWAGENAKYTFPEKNISVGENATVNVGTLKAAAKNAHITGKVVKANGTAVQGVRINANLDRGPGWSQSTSQADGTFDIAVTAGRWHVNIDQGFNSSYVYAGEPLDSDVPNDNSTVSLGNIILTYADATIEGKVVDASGNVITGMHGWVYARPASASGGGKGGFGQEYGGGINDRSGSFSIKVPSSVASTFTIGMHMPPNSDYSVSGEQNVAIIADQTVTKNLTVKKNDASVSGRLYDQNGNALTSCKFRGDVFVHSNQGEWKGAEIKDDCSFSISLLGGKEYRMGYWMEPGQGFMEKPPSPDPITVAAGQNLVKNIVVTKADAKITGRVTDPNGNGVRAFVFAGNWIEFEEGDQEFKEEDHFEKELFAGGETDSNGNFTVNVLSGHRYEVNAGVPAENSEFMPPDMVEVDMNNATSAVVNLQLKMSTGKMSGEVTVGGAPINHGFIHCWSDEGGFAGGEVRFGGSYTLNYTPGTWFCGAETFDGEIFYRTDEEEIVIGNESTVSKNFELKKSSFRVPKALSTTISDVTQSQTITLENGTDITIPAGALGEEGTARVQATPTVDLSRTKTEQPFGVGYKLEAFDSDGNAILTFNSAVTISFDYTDEQLAEFGLDENALVGKYFDEETNTWKSPNGIIQDKENNTITVSTTHFTKFAIVASGAGAAITSGSTSGSTSTLLPQHPNGTLVKAKDGGSVYLLDGGKKRPIASPSIFEARGYKWNEIVEISKLELNSYTIGADLNIYPDGYLLAGPDGKLYVISDGTKRYVTGPAIFEGLGYSWSNVLNVSSAHLALYSDGANLSSTAVHPNGSLVKTSSGGAVYLIEGGQKRAFVSPLYFDIRGYKWNSVVTITQSELDSYTSGTSIAKYPSGKILRNTDNRIWIVDGESLHYVVSPNVFEELGYKWDNVISVGSMHIGGYSGSSDLWTVMNHPNGALVTAGGGVYLIESGKKRLITSPAIFEDQGFVWGEIIKVSRAEMESYPEGNHVNVFTEGSLLVGPDGNAYTVSDGTKRHILSPAVFEGLGYKWSSLINVSAEHLALYATGSDVVSSTTRPNGMTVAKSDGNLYSVISGELRHIPTPVFFERWGGNWNNIVSISDAEFSAATKGADLTNVLPDGTLLRGSDDKIYVAANGSKRYFPGPDLFEELGYNWGNLVSTTSADLALYGNGSEVN